MECKLTLRLLFALLITFITSVCVADDSILLHHYSLVNFGLSDGARGSQILSIYSDNNTVVTEQGCDSEECAIEIITNNSVAYGVATVVVGTDAAHNCRIELIDGYRFQFPNYYTIPTCQGGFRVVGPVIGNPMNGYSLQIVSNT